MPLGLRRGTVSAIREALPELVRLEVDGIPCVAYPRLTGPVEVGDEVLVNERARLLELGSGGGNNASHLKARFECTLTDLSPDMLALSRTLNPECEHIECDMRTLRLDRRFDVVMVHGAVMYAITEDELGATLRTAALHCKPGGRVVVLPDCTRESFTSGGDCGGEDAPDGRGFRYLEWTWDPDPADDTYIVDYAFLLREPDGSMAVEHDRHVEQVIVVRVTGEHRAQIGERRRREMDVDTRGVRIDEPRRHFEHRWTREEWRGQDRVAAVLEHEAADPEELHAELWP